MQKLTNKGMPIKLIMTNIKKTVIKKSGETIYSFDLEQRIRGRNYLIKKDIMRKSTGTTGIGGIMEDVEEDIIHLIEKLKDRKNIGI